MRRLFRGAAVLQSSAEDVAERSAGVGRTELCDGFLLFGNFQRLDRKLDLAILLREVQDAGVDGLDALLTGPTAIAFVTGEPVDAAKALRDFAKDNKALVIKGGYMDGNALSVDEVNRIADLESREVLLAKLAGAMKGNLSKAAGLFAAPASQVARLAQALADKRAAEAAPAPAVDTDGDAAAES